MCVGSGLGKLMLCADNQVTRQPTNDELISGIDFAQARANEKTFFETTKPWSSMDLSLQSRLGTKNLTAFLSDKLLAFIKEKYVHA